MYDLLLPLGTLGNPVITEVTVRTALRFQSLYVCSLLYDKS